jgi:multimeric flavodoxin WrbA
MKKIIVIYHSQQYGNTKILAEAIAEGVREAGGEVNLINTNEMRVTLEEFLASDAVAIGTPDYFSYVAGTIKTFFDDISEGLRISGFLQSSGNRLCFSWFSRGVRRGSSLSTLCPPLLPAGRRNARKRTLYQ